MAQPFPQVVSSVLSQEAGNEYLTGLTLYFIGYVLFEVRTNWYLSYKNTNPFA
jgi:hypothetical protein